VERGNEVKKQGERVALEAQTNNTLPVRLMNSKNSVERKTTEK
jgi:hypothetical protein